ALHAQPDALLVDVDHGVPLLLGGLLESLHVRDTGVVDQDIQPAKLPLAELDRGAPVGRARHVETDRPRDGGAGLRIDAVGGGLQEVVADVADYDLRAFAGEQAGLRRALPPRATRDERN